MKYIFYALGKDLLPYLYEIGGPAIVILVLVVGALSILSLLKKG